MLYAPNSCRPENAYWDSGIRYSGDLCLSNTGILYFPDYHRPRSQFSKSNIFTNGAIEDNPSKSRDTTIVYRAKLDADGIFKLYSHHILSKKKSSNYVWALLHAFVLSL